LQNSLDVNKVGIILYEPLLMELQDIPAIEFVKPAFKKLAKLMIERDWDPSDLMQKLNHTREVTMEFSNFKYAL